MWPAANADVTGLPYEKVWAPLIHMFLVNFNKLTY
jgi:hypothetical protein